MAGIEPAPSVHQAGTMLSSFNNWDQIFQNTQTQAQTKMSICNIFLKNYFYCNCFLKPMHLVMYIHTLSCNCNSTKNLTQHKLEGI
jgi:hypothetical protein